MAIIRVTLGGCGISYRDAHGVLRHVLKTPESGPFECDDVQAARHVGAGVAEYVTQPEPQDMGQDEPEPQDMGQDEPEPSGDSGKMIGHLDPADLETMTIENLKKLAEDMGVDVSKCKKKADIVAAIAAVEVEVDEADALDDSDELPDLNAADPE